MDEPIGCTWKFFTEAQREIIKAILDAILPGGNGFPSAGQLGVDRYLDRIAGESPEIKSLFSRGITSLTTLSIEKYGSGFCELGDAKKTSLLTELENNDTAFFRNLVLHTYNGYYTDPNVLKILDLGVRAPQPQGYKLESGDISALKEVQSRGQIYREA